MTFAAQCALAGLIATMINGSAHALISSSAHVVPDNTKIIGSNIFEDRTKIDIPLLADALLYRKNSGCLMRFAIDSRPIINGGYHEGSRSLVRGIKPFYVLSAYAAIYFDRKFISWEQCVSKIIRTQFPCLFEKFMPSCSWKTAAKPREIASILN